MTTERSAPAPAEALILALASAMWNPDEPDLAATRMAPVLGWTPVQSSEWIAARWEALREILVNGVAEEFLEAADQCSRVAIADFARRFDALSIELTELEDDDEEATEALVAKHGIDPSVAPWLFENAQADH